MSMDVCRICLAGNIKMHSIANTRLQDIYEKLNDTQWIIDRRPATICYICHSQLNRCFKFMEMAKLSEKIFTQFFDCGFEFTEDTVAMLTKRMMQTLSVKPVQTTTVATFPEGTEVKEEPLSIVIKTEPGEDSSPEITDVIKHAPHKDSNIPGREEEVIGKNTTKNCRHNDVISRHEKNITISSNKENNPHCHEVISQTTKISKAPISTTHDTKNNCSIITKLYTPQIKNDLNSKKTSEKNVLTTKFNQSITLRFKVTNTNVHSNTNTVSDTRKREYPFNYANLVRLPYACNYCDKSFMVKYILEKHMSTHAEGKPYACKLCDRTFNIKSYLKLHKITHTGDKPYACEQCPKTFYRLKHLKQHLSNHAEEKLYVCKLCKKSFNQISNLKRHLRVHTAEKPYACDECDKRFKQISNLLQHKRAHTGEKTYGCRVCDKFAHLSNLKQHKRIHTGEMPYSCDNCCKAFRQKSNLQKHLSSFHV